MRIRIRASVSPRQSPSSLILASISREGDSPPFPSFELLFLLFMVVVFGLRGSRACRWDTARISQEGLELGREVVLDEPLVQPTERSDSATLNRLGPSSSPVR